MNSSLKPALIEGVRKLYSDNPSARRLFEVLATRQKDRKETPLGRAAWLAETSETEMVAIFKALDQLGAGTFKLGRRGSKTRIIWAYSQRHLGQAAKGSSVAPVEIEELDPQEIELAEDGSDVDEERFEGMIEHSFRLRPDMVVTVLLPGDMTGKEAERLTGFIRQLPFED